MLRSQVMRDLIDALRSQGATFDTKPSVAQLYTCGMPSPSTQSDTATAPFATQHRATCAMLSGRNPGMSPRWSFFQRNVRCTSSFSQPHLRSASAPRVSAASVPPNSSQSPPQALTRIARTFSSTAAPHVGRGRIASGLVFSNGGTVTVRPSSTHLAPPSGTQRKLLLDHLESFVCHLVSQHHLSKPARSPALFCTG